MLTDQHRMNPAIREIVSQLSYSGKLKDSDVIATRDQGWKIQLASTGLFQPDMKSSFIFINHEFPEERVRKHIILFHIILAI